MNTIAKVSVSILMLSFWAVVAVALPAHIAMLAIALMMVLTSIAI